MDGAGTLVVTSVIPVGGSRQSEKLIQPIIHVDLMAVRAKNTVVSVFRTCTRTMRVKRVENQGGGRK